MRLSNEKKNAFTLIELLVVISIIGIMSTVAMTSLNGVRKKARDARRLSDMKQIINALELYKSRYGTYPGNSDSSGTVPPGDSCGGWDVGYNGGEGSGDQFIQPLVTAGIMTPVPGDPKGTGCYTAYRYYRYGAGTSGCNVNEGAFYVLGVEDMETSGRPYPGSPGWSCPSRNWQNEFEWVTGKFEN